MTTIDTKTVYLSDCRANAARAEVAWACARRSERAADVLDATADELARARKSYWAACKDASADPTDEHYEQCRAAVSAWSRAIELARAIGVDAGIIEWMQTRRHDAGATGD